MLGAVDEVFGRPEAVQRADRRQRDGRCTRRCRTRRPAWSRSGTPGAQPEARKKSKAGTRRSTNDRDQRAGPAGAARSHATSGCLTNARPARAGDVLILVRQRGALFEAIIRALKNADIPVAGADRLVLTEHIAVMDLMVLADALLLPDDDLALATVLKSPLFGFDDDELFELAWQRRGTLRAALRAKAPAQPRFAAAATSSMRCAQWRAPRHAVRVLRPAARTGGRTQAVSSRGSGHEADDALDEFLNLALDYERRETPSLQGFVAWLRAAQSRGEARHGDRPRRGAGDDRARRQGPGGADRHPRRHHDAAGGAAQRQPRLLALPPDGAPGAPERFVWAGPKANDVALVATARERARRETEDEYRRLLYVAMTRAIDRLIVCGVEGERRPPGGLLVRSRCCAPCARYRSRKPTTTARSGAIARRRSLRSISPRPVQLPRQPPTTPPAWLDATRPRRPRLCAALAVARLRRGCGDPCASRGRPRRPREGARPRQRRAPAAAVAARHSARGSRAEAARRTSARAARTISTPRNASAIARAGTGACSTIRALPQLFAAGSRAEVPIVGRIVHDGRSARSPARSTGWW